MTTSTELEDRLRQGLRAAAEALPPAPRHDPPVPRRPHRSGATHGRRWAVGLAASAAAVAVVVAGVVAVTDPGDGGRSTDVEVGPVAPETPDVPRDRAATDGAEPHVPAPANGQQPGRAVTVDNELRTYGPNGVQTGAVSLAPLERIDAATSDLAGGWVVCGSLPADEDPAASSSPWTGGDPTSTVPVGTGSSDIEAEIAARLDEGAEAAIAGESVQVSGGDGVMWFPAGGEPIKLEFEMYPLCMADALQVVDSAEGPTLVYPTIGPVPPSLRALVLATGEERELPVPLEPNTLQRGSATTGRLLLHGDESGFRLFNIATGEDLPIGPIEATPGHVSDVALAPDGASVAIIAGEVSGPSDLVIYDLASGEERYRETFPSLPTEGAELSYDGTTVAVGSYYDSPGYPPVTVIDLASGARHTIDAYGILL